MKESLLNSTWNSLFEDFDIIKQISVYGKYEIKAKIIKKYREPRLVTKFDSFEQMPIVFRQNNLGIFPVSRDAYVIGKYNLFYPLEDKDLEIKNVNTHTNYQSLNPNQIDSESEAIQIAYLNKILSDFLEDDKIVPTFFGKKGVGTFDFKVKDNNGNIYPVKVDGGIMEVDSSFESDKNFIIIEAKNTNIKNFLIRQLYYPFRYFYPKITKKVRLVFLTYFDDKFKLFEYKFKQPEVYNSIELIQTKTYKLNSFFFNKSSFIKILNESIVFQEPRVPFPQANNLKRVFEICEYLAMNKINKEEIKKNQNFHLRQVDYYLNAGIYLELIIKEKNTYNLSDLGKFLIKATLKDKYLIVFRNLLKHEVFYNIFKDLLQNTKTINKDKILEIMHHSSLYNVKKNSTIYRRYSTVYRWTQEIMHVIED
jgi:hypothetical protein